MPNINLRLTEEEHAALREWAHESRRSLQREIIFRLFDGRISSGVAVGKAAVSGSDESIVEERSVPALTPTSRPERAAPDPHFKPDFK